MAIRAFACGADGKLRTPNIDGIGAFLSDSSARCWVDIDARTEAIDTLLTDVFGIHPLNVEDIWQDSQPKLERHADYLYIIVHGLYYKHDQPRDLEVLELDVIIGSNYLITHHPRRSRSVEDVEKLLREDCELLRKGPAFLAHAIIDRQVDRFLPLMERFGEEVEELEIDIFRNPRPELLEEIFELKHGLQRIRRSGMHQRDILRELSSKPFANVPSEATPFFRDVYDHFLRVIDLGETYRSLVSAALDGYLSVQSHKMNEVMKVLTVISTVMLPLTFITGLYGMNFEVIPELKWGFGYAYVWILMVLIAVFFVIYFRLKRWL
ncbi:MAG: magnesium/cobalt transporter CorA [Myxococcota bacterium]